MCYEKMINGLAFMGQKIWCWLLPMDSKQTDHKVSVVKIYRSTSTNKRQGEVTMRIVRECRDTLETELILGYRFQFLSVGAFPSLLN